MMTSNALLPLILIISQPRSSDTVSGAGWREVPKSKGMFSAAAHAEPLTSNDGPRPNSPRNKGLSNARWLIL